MVEAKDKSLKKLKIHNCPEVLSDKRKASALTEMCIGKDSNDEGDGKESVYESKPQKKHNEPAKLTRKRKTKSSAEIEDKDIQHTANNRKAPRVIMDSDEKESDYENNELASTPGSISNAGTFLNMSNSRGSHTFFSNSNQSASVRQCGFSYPFHEELEEGEIKEDMYGPCANGF